MEHVTILGYIEPVAGPLYAVFLVGQLPGVWTWVGGALILAPGFSWSCSAAARAKPRPPRPSSRSRCEADLTGAAA